MVVRYTPWNINMEPQNHLFENEKSSSKHELIFRGVTWLLLTVKTTSKFQTGDASGVPGPAKDRESKNSQPGNCDIWATKGGAFDISFIVLVVS